MAALLSVMLLVQPAAWGAAARTQKISRNCDSGSGCYAFASRTGRFVVYQSANDGLVPGDDNGKVDVFLRDRKLRATFRISVSSTGKQANGDSQFTYDDMGPVVTPDGRFVAFASAASNLIPRDNNHHTDVFLRDRKLHTTARVSVTRSGGGGDGDSADPSITPDGRFVAFASLAENLVSGDDNGYQDVFVRDRVLRKTFRVNVSNSGVQGDDGSWGSSISADGRVVAFFSDASTLVPGDEPLGTPGGGDIFVRDRKLKRTSLVSKSSVGENGNDYSFRPRITPDGRFVIFDSQADNLIPHDGNGSADVFVRDRKLQKTSLISLSSTGKHGDDSSRFGSISNDGRYVAFESYAENLVGNDGNAKEDVFIRDRVAHTTRLVSEGTGGTAADGFSYRPGISGDGRFVAFESNAPLVSGDGPAYDVYLRGPLR